MGSRDGNSCKLIQISMLNKAISTGLGAHDDSVLAAVISLGNGQVPCQSQDRRDEACMANLWRPYEALCPLGVAKGKVGSSVRRA